MIKNVVGFILRWSVLWSYYGKKRSVIITIGRFSGQLLKKKIAGSAVTVASPNIYMYQQPNIYQLPIMYQQPNIYINPNTNTNIKF